MQVRLREEPREWQKFTAATAATLAAMGYFLKSRGILAPTGAVVLWSFLGASVVLCLLRPRWFRSFYRRGMTINAAIGTAVGSVVVVGLFIFVLTPLGWILRLTGNDPLQLQRDDRKASYWRNARRDTNLDRMF